MQFLPSLRAKSVSLALSLVAILASGVPAAAQGLLSDEPVAPAESPLSGQEQAEQLMDEGEQALAEGNWEKALASYDPLVRAAKSQLGTNPLAEATFLTNRGRAFVGLEDLPSALADFNSAVQAYDQYLPARIYRGNLYLELNQPGAAMGDYQKVAEEERLNTAALFGLGKSYVLLGGAQQAVKPLTYVIDAPEDDEMAASVRAEAYRLRALAHTGMLEFEDAYADIDRSLSINPDDYETYFALGRIYLAEENYAQAAQAFQDAIDRYVPDDPESDEPYTEGYLVRAAALVEQGKHAEDEATRTAAYEAAMADCDTLLEQLGDSPRYQAQRAATEFRRGVALRLLGRLGDAVNALTEAINTNPELAEAYFRRGICYYYMDEFELAITDFQMASSIDYTDARARLWEGITFVELGSSFEAIRAYGQALTESDRYVPAYINRGLVYMVLEDHEKAIDDFNQAILLEPTVAGHYFKRGMAYERLGKYERAADSFAHAARLDRNFSPAYRHAADSLAALGYGDLANEYRSRADEIEAAARP